MLPNYKKKDQLFFLEMAKNHIQARWGLILFILIASFTSQYFASLTLHFVTIFFACFLWAVGNLALTLHTMMLEKYTCLAFPGTSIKRLMKSWDDRGIPGKNLGKLSLIYLNFVHSTGQLVSGLLNVANIGNLQTGFDIVVLLAITFLSGGIESPFLWLLLIPLAEASLSLPPRAAFYHLLVAIFGLSAGMTGVFFGWVGKTTFVQPLYGDFTEIGGYILFSLATFMVLSGGLYLLYLKLAAYYRNNLKLFNKSLYNSELNANRYRYALSETDISVLVLDSALTITDSSIISSNYLFRSNLLGKSVFSVFSDLDPNEVQEGIRKLSLKERRRSLRKIHEIREADKFFKLELAFYLIEDRGSGERLYDLIIRDYTETGALKTRLMVESLKIIELENATRDQENGLREARESLATTEAKYRQTRDEMDALVLKHQEERQSEMERLVDEASAALSSQQKHFQEEIEKIKHEVNAVVENQKVAHQEETRSLYRTIELSKQNWDGEKEQWLTLRRKLEQQANDLAHRLREETDTHLASKKEGENQARVFEQKLQTAETALGQRDHLLGDLRRTIGALEGHKTEILKLQQFLLQWYRIPEDKMDQLFQLTEKGLSETTGFEGTALVIREKLDDGSWRHAVGPEELKNLLPRDNLSSEWFDKIKPFTTSRLTDWMGFPLVSDQGVQVFVCLRNRGQKPKETELVLWLKILKSLYAGLIKNYAYRLKTQGELQETAQRLKRMEEFFDLQGRAGMNDGQADTEGILRGMANHFHASAILLKYRDLFGHWHEKSVEATPGLAREKFNPAWLSMANHPRLGTVVLGESQGTTDRSWIAPLGRAVKGLIFVYWSNGGVNPDKKGLALLAETLFNPIENRTLMEKEASWSGVFAAG